MKSDGSVGQFMGATSQTSTTTMINTGYSTTTTGKAQNLNYADAAKVFGGRQLSFAAQEAARLSSRGDPVEGFIRTVGKDIGEHPYRYTFHAAGLALPFTEIPVLAEGAITGVEALVNAYELGKEMHGGGQ
jgi:hypothetical protein